MLCGLLFIFIDIFFMLHPLISCSSIILCLFSSPFCFILLVLEYSSWFLKILTNLSIRDSTEFCELIQCNDVSCDWFLIPNKKHGVFRNFSFVYIALLRFQILANCFALNFRIRIVMSTIIIDGPDLSACENVSSKPPTLMIFTSDIRS